MVKMIQNSLSYHHGMALMSDNYEPKVNRILALMTHIKIKIKCIARHQTIQKYRIFLETIIIIELIKHILCLIYRQKLTVHRQIKCKMKPILCLDTTVGLSKEFFRSSKIDKKILISTEKRNLSL